MHTHDTTGVRAGLTVKLLSMTPSQRQWNHLNGDWLIQMTTLTLARIMCQWLLLISSLLRQIRRSNKNLVSLPLLWNRHTDEFNHSNGCEHEKLNAKHTQLTIV